jgi:hypothetical protein
MQDLNNLYDSLINSDINDKILQDIRGDLQAMIDLLEKYDKMRNNQIDVNQFKAAYNIYRSKRGAIGYED